jgi:hypothetical protein
VVGRLRIDEQLRAVRIDVEAAQITALPGLAADPPVARFTGDQATIAWYAAAGPERVLHVIEGDTAWVFPLVAQPPRDSTPAIIGSVDGLRLAVMIAAEDTAQLQLVTVTPEGRLRVDAERVAPALIEGRLHAVRLGRNAVIAHVGGGAIWRYAAQLEPAELAPLPPLRNMADVAATAVDRSAAGLLAISVAPQAQVPCALHLLRTTGEAVDLSLAGPVCTQMRLAYTPDGVALFWIDTNGRARRAQVACQ